MPSVDDQHKAFEMRNEFRRPLDRHALVLLVVNGVGFVTHADARTLVIRIGQLDAAGKTERRLGACREGIGDSSIGGVPARRNAEIEPFFVA